MALVRGSRVPASPLAQWLTGYRFWLVLQRHEPAERAHIMSLLRKSYDSDGEEMPHSPFTGARPHE